MRPAHRGPFTRGGTRPPSRYRRTAAATLLALTACVAAGAPGPPLQAPPDAPGRTAPPAHSTADRGDRAPRAASLSIAKTVAPDPVTAGDDAVYRITVSNNGDSDATGVTVTDQLDSHVTAGDLPAGCSASGQTVTCSGLTVPAGDSTVVEIPVTVDSSTSDGTNLTNRATATTSGGSTVDTQLITISRTLTDVEVRKTGNATVSPDGTITYTITVTNDGPSDAVDVTVQDETNQNLAVVTERPDECPGGGTTISCGLGTLKPGETRTLTFTEQAGPDLAPGTVIPNCAQIYTGSRQQNTANDRSCVETTVVPDQPDPTDPVSPDPDTPDPTDPVSPDPDTPDPTDPPTDTPTEEPTGSPTTEPTDGPTPTGTSSVPGGTPAPGQSGGPGGGQDAQGDSGTGLAGTGGSGTLPAALALFASGLGLTLLIAGLYLRRRDRRH